VLVATGWFPTNIEFDVEDLATVVDILNQQAKAMK